MRFERTQVSWQMKEYAWRRGAMLKFEHTARRHCTADEWDEAFHRALCVDNRHMKPLLLATQQSGFEMPAGHSLDLVDTMAHAAAYVYKYGDFRCN